MTTQTITRDLRNPCAEDTRMASRLDNPAGCTDENKKSRKRFSLWEILFDRPWEQSSRERVGGEMQPFVVSMPGGSYTVADNQRSLASAAHAGPVSTMAEVWQNTLR